MKSLPFAALIALQLALAPAAQAELSKAESAMAKMVEAEQPRSIALLEKLVNQNSGSLNLEGVEKIGAMMRAELEPLGFTVTWKPMRETGRAGHLIATHKGKRDGKRLLLIAHLDTVFEPDSPFQRFERRGDFAKGPGAGDDKGGMVVALAALHNATQRVGRKLDTSVIGQVGLGAAGLGIARLLRAHGCGRILGADRDPAALDRLAALGGERSTLAAIMATCDVVIATTGAKGLIRPEWVRAGQVILALSNPDPEIEPIVALQHGAAFAADGKGINNVLGFPGLFKGALEARATSFTDAMLMAAAHRIAELAPTEQLVPDALDPAVHLAVTEAVRAAAAR